MKALIKSKLIYNGQQIEGKTIDVSRQELDYFTSINVNYELKEKKKSEFQKSRIQDEGLEPGD